MEASITAKAFEILLGYGMPGLVILGLLWDRRRLTTEIVGLQKQLTDCYAARIESKERIITAIERSNTTAATLIASREAMLKLLEQILNGVLELLRQGQTSTERDKTLIDTLKELARDLADLVRGK